MDLQWKTAIYSNELYFGEKVHIINSSLEHFAIGEVLIIVHYSGYNKNITHLLIVFSITR